MGTQRVVWKASPDTEEIRRHLLELLAVLEEKPAQNEYFPPLSAYFPTSTVAKTVVWQLGELRETRAVPRLARIIARDGGQIIEYARKAFAKIEEGPQRRTNRMETTQPSRARQLFLDVLDWLRETYSDHKFFTERDVVWTVQKRLLKEASRRNLLFRVFHGYRMTSGNARSAPADLVLLGTDDRAELAIEFKYEPDHARANTEFPPTKFPVVEWNYVIEDTERVQQFRRKGFARNVCALFIDEGRHFRRRKAPRGSRWEEWDVGNGVRIAVLISEA